MDTKNPIKTRTKFACITCDYECSKPSDFTRHNLTVKHLKRTCAENIIIETAKKFVCATCDFRCSYKRDYDVHLSTAKHARIPTATKDAVSTIKCACGKEFKYKSGLYKHLHKCSHNSDTHRSTPANEVPTNEVKYGASEDLKEMIISCLQNQEFLKTVIVNLLENQQKQTEIQNGLLESQKTQNEQNNANQRTQFELQNKIIEAIPHVGTTTNIQTQNNTFNLNTYLTVTCKDAETFDETKKNLKSFVLELDSKEFIDFASHSSPNAIMEKVIRDFYSNTDPHKRSIQTVDVARGKSYVKHTEEEGFVLDDEGKAVSTIGQYVGHYSNVHCPRYCNLMKTDENTWKASSIGCLYENTALKINNIWRDTDANKNTAKKVVGSATKIEKGLDIDTNVFIKMDM